MKCGISTLKVALLTESLHYDLLLPAEIRLIISRIIYLLVLHFEMSSRSTYPKPTAAETSMHR